MKFQPTGIELSCNILIYGKLYQQKSIFASTFTNSLTPRIDQYTQNASSRNPSIDMKQLKKKSIPKCFKWNTSFYPTALKGCRGIVFTHGVRMGGRAAGNSLSGLYLRNRKV